MNPPKEDSQSILPSMIGQGVTIVDWDLVYEVVAGNILMLREVLACNTLATDEVFAVMISPSDYVPVSGVNQPYVQVIVNLVTLTSYILQLATAVPSGFKVWVYGSVDDLNYHISGVPVQR